MAILTKIQAVFNGLIHEVANFLYWLFNGMKEDVASTDNELEVKIEEQTTNHIPSNREKLYQVAFDCIGVDMAPTQDALGCAEALYHVMKKAGVPNLPKTPIVSSFEIDKWCQQNLTKVDTPQAGDIISSPTGLGNGRVRGHVGIVGKHSIMSNNSSTFKWDYHWKLDEWEAYYGGYGGLPVRFYRWV